MHWSPATYASGPITLGLQGAYVNSQGYACMTSVSQRHEYEVALGGAYKLAPDVQVVCEYMYTHRHQGGFVFANNALAATWPALTLGR
jgi:hypothetical protein